MLYYCRYVSRAHVRDSSKHVILGTQQYKPNEFAAQINLNMDNAWGILRCIVDLVMKQKDGKFLIMKDPNKVIDNFTFLVIQWVQQKLILTVLLQPMIRLYDIPDNTFDSETEDAEDDDG